MSVRIYELSKQIGMDNKELMLLLRDRGFEIKSASSTIDNISAESLVDEFSKPEALADTAVEARATEPQDAVDVPARPKLPSGAIVRSRAEIEAERKAREDEEKAQRRNALVTKTPVLPGQQQEAAAAPQQRFNRPPATPPPLRNAPPPVSRPVGNRPPVAVPARPAAHKPVTPGGVAIPGIKPPLAQRVPDKPLEQRTVAVAPQPAASRTAAPAVPQPVVSRPTSAPSAAPAASRPASVAPPSVAPQRTGPASVAPPSVAPQRTGPASVAPPAPAPAAPPAAGGSPLRDSSETAPSEMKSLVVKPPIVVRDFAGTLGLKPFRLISELMDMGIFASMNQTIDEEVALRVAKRHGFFLDIKHRGEQQQQQQKKKEEPKVDEAKLMEPRPPIVCILGHVDHGKTTLLDTIRNANVVKGEAGGITQHIGAYQIDHNGKKITFIDTPGHAAFTNMRARGAHVTDVAILVVAADDGFMPQTDEALKHAQNAHVPVLVAINKVDAKGANIDRVKKQMQERNMAPEDWGGETICVPVSALKGDGIEDLLEMILLQAEIMELKAVTKAPGEGIVVETQKEVGRGSTASVIIQKGTIKVGDALVCGPVYCKVRSLMDDRGKNIKSATPATPLKVMGWSGNPDSGSHFTTVKDERTAKRIAEENAYQIKRELDRDDDDDNDNKKDALDALFGAISQKRQQTFRVLVKADVYGTAEALATCLEDIKSDKIEIEVIQIGVGPISKNDIVMCSAADAKVIGFNVGLDNGVAPIAKHHNIKVLSHNIIYELIQQVRNAMADELPPELRENKLGAAEVRVVFPVAKGLVAGCMVTEGIIKRDARARLLRKGKVTDEGRINTLKRFKDDATEVRAGYECGIAITDCNNYQEGDVIEVYEIRKIRAEL